MTDDDAERQKQFLKQLLRTQRDLRRAAEKLRPSTPEAVDQRWKEQQLRWAVEDELDREEEEAAATRRQQESAAPAIDPPSPEPELREAPEPVIRSAVLDVYKRTPEGQGPNVNDVISPVEELLKTRTYKTSGRRIRKIAEEAAFAKYRRKLGTHRS
jgi:hypothetical protein